MLGAETTHGLHRSRARLILQHELLGELAGLDLGQDALHLSLGLAGDDARTTGQVAVLGGVGDRVAHVGDAALVDEVDDQLHFVQTLEVGHLGRVTGLDQGLETGLDQRGQTAAQHHLLTEQVGLALLAEGGLDDAGTTAAVGRGISHGDVARLAAGVLVDRDQRGHAAALGVGRAHQVARTLGGDHDDVQILTRGDLAEVDVEAVSEGQRRALLDVRLDLLAIERALMLVGGQDHDHVGVGHGFCDRLDGQTGIGGLGRRGRTRTQRHGDGDAGVLEVVGVGMALRAIADDGHFLPLDQRKVGVFVVIHVDGHAMNPSLGWIGFENRFETGFRGSSPWRHGRCRWDRSGRPR